MDRPGERTATSEGLDLATDPFFDDGTTSTAAGGPFEGDDFLEDATIVDTSVEEGAGDDEPTVATSRGARPRGGPASQGGAGRRVRLGDTLGEVSAAASEDLESLPTMTGMKDDPARGIDLMWQKVAPPSAAETDGPSDARLEQPARGDDGEDADEGTRSLFGRLFVHDGRGWRLRLDDPLVVAVLAVAVLLLAYLAFHAWQNITTDLATFEGP